MLRGSQTLTAIFSTDIQPAPKKVKGIYTAERDAALAYRFYYHYDLIRKRFDDVVTALAQEFYISSTTVVERLTYNDSLLKDIKSNSPNRHQLRKRYPHFNWN